MNPSATVVVQAPVAPWCVCDVVELILEFLRPFTTITSLRAVNRTFRQAVSNTREVWSSMLQFIISVFLLYICSVEGVRA
jgi:hypothetical protein